jgi:signal transduction histidine kinase
VLYVAALAFLDTGWISPEVFAIIAWPSLAVAAGDALRTRRAYAEELADRARRAEAARQDAARRQAAEERLRIARDLHDLVAHRMAVINVQSAAAKVQLRSDPDEAERSLDAVRTSASTVLDELGGLLRVLREPGDDQASPTVPAPALTDLDDLVSSFAAAGLRVETRTTGTADTVPETVQLATYRIVQEALTNAQRHGDGRARLDLTYGVDAVDVVIENGVPSRATPPGRQGHGYGLVGMHERVVACGGSIEAGPAGVTGFRVAVHLPFAAGSAP